MKRQVNRHVGREAYAAIAEELSDEHTTLADIDPHYVRAAEAYAHRAHKKWPPTPTTSGWQMHVASVPCDDCGRDDGSHDMSVEH